MGHWCQLTMRGHHIEPRSNSKDSGGSNSLTSIIYRRDDDIKRSKVHTFLN